MGAATGSSYWCRAVVLAFGVCLLVACGSEMGTGPSPPPPVVAPGPTSTNLRVVSGETQAPVANATVTAAGRDHTTDASGQVRLEPALTANASVDIVADGFLARQTSYRSGETTLSLWPRQSPTGLTEHVTQRLVYTFTRRDSQPGAFALNRPSVRTPIFVVPDSAIRSSFQAMRILEESVGVLRDALRGEIRVDIIADGSVPNGVVFELVINADATSSDFVGDWRRFLAGRTITGARLRFRSLARLIDNPQLVTHNLGHAFGFNHSPDDSDRMSARWWQRRANNFSAREVLLLRLMLQRRPGTVFPDNDRNADRNLLRTIEFGSH